MGGLSLPHQGSLKVSSTEPRTILVHLPWTDHASFESVCTNVLLRRTLGKTDCWVCYGPAGDSGEVTLEHKEEGAAPTQVDFTYPSDATVEEIPLDSGDGHHAVLLVMNTELTNKTWLAHDKLNQTPWYFRGGLTDLQETPIVGRVIDWSEFLTSQPWQNGAPSAPNLPAFWKCTFAYHPPAGMRETIGLLTDGLRAGHVWLNGHNLGECPQPIPLYLPECWLNDGNNDLVIFDLYGRKPDQARLIRYEAFSIRSGPVGGT